MRCHAVTQSLKSTSTSKYCAAACALVACLDENEVVLQPATLNEEAAVGNLQAVPHTMANS